MDIQQIQYRSWKEAYLCTNGESRLIVVSSVGPRILFLQLGDGPNFLYQDETGFGVGDWRLIGGHRFSTAPESPSSYLPDNRRCQVESSGEGMKILSPVDDNGLQRLLYIGPDGSPNAFHLGHTLINQSEVGRRVSPWAITCVSPSGRIVVPQDPFQDARVKRIHFWDNGDNYQANPLSSQWSDREDAFVVEPSGEVGKVGLYSTTGRVAYVRHQEIFTIAPTEIPEPAACPHAGCNVEVYTCPHWMEMETLGAVATLEPGQHRNYCQSWRLFTGDFAPQEMNRYWTEDTASGASLK